MITVSQKTVLLTMVIGFLVLSVLGLHRAKTVVLPQAVMEASESVPIPQPLIKKETVEEIQQVVGRHIPTLHFVPENYAQESIGYRTSSGGYLIRQTFIDPGSGHISLEQRPVMAGNSSTIIGMETEELMFDNKSITLASRNGAIYSMSWETDYYRYELSSLESFDRSVWKKMVVSIQ